MFSPSKSAPKMRRAMTPRVKSSHNLQQAYMNKAHNFTSQKNNQNNNYHQNINPQKVEEHLNKKLNFNNIMNNNDKKNNFEVLPTAISINQKPSIIHSHNNLIHKDPKIIGRDIQWNANNKPNKQNNNLHKQNQQKKQQPINKTTRSMSAHTLRSNNDNKNMNSFTQKSLKIKQQKKQFQQKFNVAFNYLIGQNYQYLGQRLSMCNQKARPKQKIFKMQKANGLTVYQNDYTKKFGQKGQMYKLQIQPQNQKTALFISPSKIYDKTKQHQIHNNKVKQGKKADLATWPQGYRLQGPTYSVTTNQNAYPNHGQFQKMVPIATFNEHPLGMPHKTTSTHRNFFKGEHTPRADLATWNNLHPYGNEFNPIRGTHYQNTHGDKQMQPIQQWPHPQHKLTNVESRMFTTEIKDNFKDFTESWLNQQNRCKCGRKRH